jgi:energy-coupling factor transporter transmembrane protein EcfT
MTGMGITALLLLKNRIFLIFYKLRFFVTFLFIIFIIQSISIPGSPIFKNPLIPATWEGVQQGSRLVWRMLLISLLSLVYISTTTSSDTREAVKRFFRPIPFIPEEQLALMITLMVRFIPFILNQVQEIGDAQKARGIERRKNPYYRIKYLAVPLFREVFETAEELAEAMESRCFGGESTPVPLSSNPNDWFCTLMVFSGCFFALLS